MLPSDIMKNHFSIVTLTLLVFAGPALAGNPIAKATKLALRKPAAMKPAPLPAAPVDNMIGARSACKNHVENMLKNPATQFASDDTIHVSKMDDANFDVAGPVHSAKASGQAIGGDFHCHAQLIGGAVWSTKTSLDFTR